MAEFDIMELITGPLAVGRSFDLSSIKMADFLARLEAVDLTTPVHALPTKEVEMIEYIREELRTATPERGSHGPLTPHAHLAEWITRRQLELYIEPDHPRADRLYVLEFQGPWQYVMFGHTTNLMVRVAEHQRAASAHGFALVNGWASPWANNVQPLEYNALSYAGLLHHGHYRERFSDMLFEFGVKIVRLIFETMSDWRLRSRISSSATVVS